MTDVLEVLLELEYLRADLAQHPLKVGLPHQSLILVEQLVSIMAMILKDIMTRESLEHLEQISSGDMT